MSVFVTDVGQYKNLTATGAVTTASATPGFAGGSCQMIGFYVNSTSSGAIAWRDGGSGGTVLGGTITPAIGFHRYPAIIGTSLHLTLVSGTIDLTVFFTS